VCISPFTLCSWIDKNFQIETDVRSNQNSVIDFFFYLGCETIGTAATPGLLCQPGVIMKMIVESMMECRLAGETEVLGENLPQRNRLRFFYLNF
jgi:hypothetical protein